MKINIFVLIFCIINSFIAIGQENKEFNKLLKDNGLEFELPLDFIETAVYENGDLYYNHAIKFKQDSFEVRYTIFPLYPLLEDYKKSLNDPNTMELDPNKYHGSMFMANILNVSQTGPENMPAVTDFPIEAVKNEFGADYGGFYFFIANSEFGKNYKYCLMMVIHKRNIADVYVSFLGNDKEKFNEYMLKAFHAIRFK